MTWMGNERAHENHVAGIFVTMGENVGALDGLWIEAKDVIAAENSDGCR